MARGLFVKGFAFCGASLCMLILCGAMYAQQDPQQDTAQQGPAQPNLNVARLSFVQGTVQMAAGGQNDLTQAVTNMPLLAGSRLQTGEDGQAEVEFGDGSVARLTPNSSLQLDRVGEDQIDMQQLSGLGYYELNFGQGHPSFSVQFRAAAVTATANTIFRLDLDDVPEVAVITGSVGVSGSGIQGSTVNENQTLRFDPSNGSPYTLAQGINGDSWDQWNQDRDKAISEEASEQTPVRDDSGNAGDENWNDLDADGNWYSVPDTGNVWVPSGVSATWDPFGYGYWGFYPGLGYTWISGYPWGWLPYHCGAWAYFSFGWGWTPGGCGMGWVPVVAVRGYPGYFIPAHPVFHGRGAPVLSQRLVMVDRGPQSRGMLGPGQSAARVNHEAMLNVDGHAISPVSRTAFTAQAFSNSNRGTSPGVRAALNNSAMGSYSRAGSQSAQQYYRQEPDSSAQRETDSESQNRQIQTRTNSYAAGQTARPTYTPRAPTVPHYTAPPRYSGNSPHYSPPAPHYSAPPSGGRGR